MCLTAIFFKTVRFRKAEASFKGKAFRLDIADSLPKKMLGLMYREGIKPDEGMIFNFGRTGRYDIWMLNMKFPIDIIWLDKDANIIKIAADAQPCHSMLSCKAYASPGNAMYVVELASGTAKAGGMAEGSRFILPNIKGFHGKYTTDNHARG